MKKTLIAVLAVCLCVLYACGGGGGLPDDSVAPATGAPTIETVAGSGAGGEVLDTLVESRILSETTTNDDLVAYQPGQDTDRLDVSRILNAFEKHGHELKFEDKNELLRIADNIIDGSKEKLRKSNDNLLLKKILGEVSIQ